MSVSDLPNYVDGFSQFCFQALYGAFEVSPPDTGLEIVLCQDQSKANIVTIFQTFDRFTN